MDKLTPAERSSNMSRIRGKDTRPELIVRKLCHSLGYRFRLHRRDLPGRPDLVFAKHRKIIFVHGCFWHRHTDCKYAYTPKSNTGFWGKKFMTNILRDKLTLSSLEEDGWKVLIIWECETRDINSLTIKIQNFL